MVCVLHSKICRVVVKVRARVKAEKERASASSAGDFISIINQICSAYYQIKYCLLASRRVPSALVAILFTSAPKVKLSNHCKTIVQIYTI